MPASGGGGMVGYDAESIVLDILFWALTLALGLIIAGAVLLLLHRRLRARDQTSPSDLAERLARIEAQLDRSSQERGERQAWTTLQEREREQNAGR